MRQTWNSSLGTGNIGTGASGLLWFWWLSWVIGNILNRLALRAYDVQTYDGYLRALWVDLAATLVSGVCGIVFLVITIRITRAQLTGQSVDVFD